jgi:hypothetical protein
MAVTDLTDSLPYWARQGGPGPTGGPGSAPMGAGNSASWLEYLQQMFAPQAAQAADNPQIAALKAAAAAQANGAPPQAGPGNVPVPQSVASLQPTPALRPPGISQPAGVSASGLPLQPGALSPGALSQFAPAAGGPIGSGGNVPWPSGGGSMNQTAPPPVGQTAPGSVPGPLATGGAGGVGATSNPRFVQLDQGQNTDPTARNRGPQMTALNLAGLFNGGGPSSRVMSPANVGSSPGMRVVSGPLAAGGISNAPMPPTMPDDIRRQRAIQLAAARSGFA